MGKKQEPKKRVFKSVERTMDIVDLPRTLEINNEESFLQGYYIDTRSLPTRDWGERTVHYFRTESGRVLKIWGFKDLNMKLAGVGKGEFVHMTYNGKNEEGEHMCEVGVDVATEDPDTQE